MRKSNIQIVREWNNKYPIGTNVSVRLDDGTSKITKTRSTAWVLGSSSTHEGHTPVVKVDGISGGYLLSRVSPIKGDSDK